METAVPVLVLDVGYGGLGIARSLGRIGVPLYAVAPGNSPALASRYWRGRMVWNFARADQEASVNFLREVRGKIGRPAVVMPTSDVTAVFVAEHAAMLGDWFIFPHRAPGLVRALVNKQEMYRLAEAAGVQTAQTWFPRLNGDLEHWMASAGFPLFVKAVDPQLPPGSTKEICSTPREMRTLYERMAPALRANLMVQEFIPGNGHTTWLFNGYFGRDGRCLASFTGKKIRQYPAYTGVASVGVWLHNEAVERSGIAFMESIGYRGPVDVDFRFDARDGAYKILDVNPRIGAAFRLFVDDAGMDVARIYYLDVTGQAVPPVRPREGRKWMLEDDVASFLHYRRDGRLTLGAWARSLRGVEETAWFAFDDPSPLLTRLRQGLRHAYRGIGGVGNGADRAKR